MGVVVVVLERRAVVLSQMVGPPNLSPTGSICRCPCGVVVLEQLSFSHAFPWENTSDLHKGLLAFYWKGWGRGKWVVGPCRDNMGFVSLVWFSSCLVTQLQCLLSRLLPRVPWKCSQISCLPFPPWTSLISHSLILCSLDPYSLIPYLLLTFILIL